MARDSNVTRGRQIHAASDQRPEELPGGHTADVVLHGVPLAVQDHLVHPRNSKAIPKLCQDRLDRCSAQLGYVTPLREGFVRLPSPPSAKSVSASSAYQLSPVSALHPS